jgi:hypothetical protein
MNDLAHKFYPMMARMHEIITNQNLQLGNNLRIVYNELMGVKSILQHFDRKYLINTNHLLHAAALTQTNLREIQDGQLAIQREIIEAQSHQNHDRNLSLQLLQTRDKYFNCILDFNKREIANLETLCNRFVNLDAFSTGLREATIRNGEFLKMINERGEEINMNSGRIFIRNQRGYKHDNQSKHSKHKILNTLQQNISDITVQESELVQWMQNIDSLINQNMTANGKYTHITKPNKREYSGNK